MNFLTSLDPLLQTFWYIAIPASLIFIVQTIMTFVGADSTDGIDADFDSNLDGADAPFQLFSLRNLINFLLGFSWTGISFFNSINNHTILILVAFLVGALFLVLFFLIIKQITKLAEDNSFKYTDTLHKSAEVYLTIPAQKNGKGRILISVKGSTHELDAMTTGNAIEVGKLVKVVKIENENILIVETI